MTPVSLEPAALRSRVKHSTTEPLCSLIFIMEENTMNPDQIAPFERGQCCLQ